MRRSIQLLLMAAAWAVPGCGDGHAYLQDHVANLERKARLLAAMRIDLLASEDAEKSAVLATTDSASEAFADQSRQASQAVEHRRLELDSLVSRDPTDRQTALAGEFDTCWSGLRQIDQTVLDFAVRNTNVKAYALSFGLGRAAMDRSTQALQHIARRSSRDRNCGALLAASEAMAAGLTIYALHAPHIAESSDARMGAMEARMQALADTVQAAFGRLKPLLEAGDADLRAAEEANQALATVTAEVVRLSRLNTNVKSFELSLGTKRKVAAQCDEVLAGLEEEVRGTQFRATR